MAANRRLRFSLRFLLVLMVMIAIGLGLYARLRSRAHQQQRLVTKITEAGGFMRYDFECYSESPWYAIQRSLAPRMGPDFAGNILILNFEPGRPDSIQSLKSATKLPKLQYVSLCVDQELADGCVEQLGQMPRLKHIHLTVTSRLPSLEPLTSLSDLELLGLHSSRGVSANKLRPLRDVAGLRTLDLPLTDANDEVAQLLATFPALEELHVEFSGITRQGVAQLKACQSLKTLHVDSTQAVDGLEKDLPGVKVDVK